MSDIIYILSKVEEENSFEKITKKEYNQFRKLKEPTLDFSLSPGKHHGILIKLNDGWKIEIIKDKDMIKAINKLWDYLHHYDHISQALENSALENN